MVVVVDDAELTLCHTVNALVGLYVPSAVALLLNRACEKLGRMAYLECDGVGRGRFLPWALGDEVQGVHAEMVLIDTLWVVAV